MTSMNIVLTMDCEPTTQTSDAAATGPGDWALGERAVRGYAEIAARYGLPATYFIHPEAATAQADLFLDMQARSGSCLGLHIHPWKYAVHYHAGQRYLAHYGGLSEDEQRSLLCEASERWEAALGRRPALFRPGTFSANDAIFRVLDALGFNGGSCSAPGRMMPEMQAIWTGACPDPHRAHDCFRQLPGELDFVNLPLSMDFSTTLEGRIGRRMHPDLRPDTDWLTQYGVSYSTIADNIVAQTLARGPAVPTVSIVTHNHYDFQDAHAPATRRLMSALEALMTACRNASVTPVGATLDDIVTAVRAQEVVRSPFVCEGSIMERTGQVATLGG